MLDFKTLYNKLNTKQKTAVDTIYGPVIVVAGPGTGKTQTIAIRTANILKTTDTRPQDILILTYTHSASLNMKDRLINLIGNTAYDINIMTIHAFCNMVIQENKDEFSILEELEVILDLDQYKLIQDIIKYNIKKLHYLVSYKNINHHIGNIISKISILKRENIPPSKFKKLIDNWGKILDSNKELSKKTGEETKKSKENRIKKIKKSKELLLIYEKYTKNLKKFGLYDFDDMINFVKNKFDENKNLLSNYQERFLFIQVDEYQDTNTSQNDIIYHLTNYEKPNIFVVGDDDQSIFRFQGASIENIKNFLTLFPKCEIITLDINYRNTKNILHCSNNLIDHNNNRLVNIKEKNITKKITSYSETKGEKINFGLFTHEDFENYFIIQKIKKLHKKGVNWEDICVICKKWDNIKNLEELLYKENIPFQLLGNKDIKEELLIKKFINILKFIDNPDNDNLFWEVFYSHLILKNKEKDLFFLYKDLKKDKKESLLYTLLDIPTKKQSINTKQYDLEVFLNIANKILYLKNESYNLTLTNFIFEVVKQFNIIEDYIKENDIQSYNLIRTFLNFVKNINIHKKDLNLKNLLNILEDYDEFNIKLKEENISYGSSRLNITTVHSAKGQEFDYIFLLHTSADNWEKRTHRDNIELPILKEINEKDILEEQRRLFYVAITRAKKEIFITLSENYIGKSRECERSQFINELDNNYIESINTQKIESDYTNLIKSLFNKSANKKDNFYDYLENLVKNLSLSPTALNNYLKCPRYFLYNSLIKLPKAKNAILSFGTCVHMALDQYYKKYVKDKKWPSYEKFLKFYYKSLNKELLIDKDKEKLAIKGEHVLQNFYNKYISINQNNINILSLEQKINIVKNNIPLNGKIDRIDNINNNLKIIDYKTGSEKTLKYIQDPENLEKSTQGSNIARQIYFYKILLNKYSIFQNYNLKYWEIVFIEAKKRFIVNGEFEKNKELKVLQMIQNTYDNIQKLKFDKIDKGDKCEKCEYKNMCWK